MGLFDWLKAKDKPCDDFKAVVFKDKTKEWRFRLVASNHQVIASSEGYKRKIDCEHAIELINSSHFYIIEEVN